MEEVRDAMRFLREVTVGQGEGLGEVLVDPEKGSEVGRVVSVVVDDVAGKVEIGRRVDW